MEHIELKLNENKQGAFIISEDGEQLGEMILAISGNYLTVYHTEVSPKAEGRNFAKKMLASMVEYAREHSLQVIPLCPFVHAQFKRHPEQYADLWTPELDSNA